MTEREPMSPFEARLALRLHGYAQVPARRVDANVAAALEWRAGYRPRRFGIAWPAAPVLRWLVLAALLVVLVATAALVAGMLLHLDGRHLGRLVYADSNGGLYLADASGQNAHKIQDGRFERPIWSPDGRFIAVVHDSRTGQVLEPGAVSLEILLADGSLVMEHAATTVNDYRWSPGTQDLLAATVDNRLAVWDVEGRSNTTVTSELVRLAWAWTSTSTIVWTDTLGHPSADGYWFEAARIDRGGQTLIVQALPRLRFEFPGPPTVDSFGQIVVSPDGAMLASGARLDLSRATDLVVLPVDGGLVRSIRPNLSDTASIAWTADATSVIAEAFNERTDVHLMVVPVDGSAVRPLFDQALFDSWLLLDGGAIDLARQPVLIGRVPTDDRQSSDVVAMDLYLLDHRAGLPRSLSHLVLGADIHWQ